jgi:hypothetical protein
MIQPLRAVHRRAFVGMAVVLPAILMIGLGGRRPRLAPIAHTTDAPVTAHVVRDSNNLWQKHAIQSKFYSTSDHPQDIIVVLQTAQELNAPDLLLYWSASEPQGNAWCGDGELVGGFTNGKAYLLPLDERRSGYLILFSSAHQTVFDTARVEKLP